MIGIAEQYNFFAPSYPMHSIILNTVSNARMGFTGEFQTSGQAQIRSIMVAIPCPKPIPIVESAVSWCAFEFVGEFRYERRAGCAERITVSDCTYH